DKLVTGVQTCALPIYVEAGPVVPHEEDGALAGAPGLRADFDAGVLALARVFDRVAQQIREHLLQQQRVTVALRQLTDDDLDRAAFRLRGQLVEGMVDYVPGLDGLGADGLTSEA